MFENKYPNLVNRKNAKLIRIKVAPLDRPSNHLGGSLMLTKEAAKQLIKESKFEHMPIHYSKVDENLPKKHKTNNNEYIEIGHIINNGEIVTEEGIQYLEVDAILHAESQKKYVDEILTNQEQLGNSWELIPEEGFENNGITSITKIDDFLGNAILDKDFTAFDGTKIVYASKSEEEIRDEIVTEEQVDKLLEKMEDEEKKLILFYILKIKSELKDCEEKHKTALVDAQHNKEMLEDTNRENERLYTELNVKSEQVYLYRELLDIYRNKNTENDGLEIPIY